jgi:hypothetical protein
MIGTRAERFWSKVDVGGKSECWMWKACIKKGYGWFDGRNAQVTAWELTHSPVEKYSGVYVCHTCDNPLCVNPDHLFLGTLLDNARDRHSKGRDAYMKGSANPSAKITESDAIAIRELHSSGAHSVRDIAERYNLSLNSVRRILNRTRWVHV